MDITKLKEELEKIEEKRFMLDMKDHWTSENYKLDDELFARRKEIEQELLKYGIKVYSKYSHDINYIEEKPEEQ